MVSDLIVVLMGNKLLLSMPSQIRPVSAAPIVLKTTNRVLS
jgi:hypothetical protein